MAGAVIEPEEGFRTLSIFEVIPASTLEYSKARVVWISLQLIILRFSM